MIIKKDIKMFKVLIFIMTSLLMLHADGGVLSVQWPSKNHLQEKIQKSYPVSLTDKIKKVTMPVLLPKSYIFNQKMSIVSDKNFYSITIFLKGANLVISGDKSYQLEMRDIDVKSQKILKRVQQEFITSEGMMMTDFNRYGVNYSMMLECDNFEQDKRCANDDFLRKAYRDLVLVGGKK